jgi:ABC-2 type transport system ATP-binding protein
VRQLVEEGVTILLTTQYLEEADVLADRIALLDHGRIVARGSAGELKQRLGSEVIRLEFGTDASFDRAAASLVSVRADGGNRTLDVATDGTASHVYQTLAQLVRAGTPASTMSIHRPSLDDVFLSLTGTQYTETESREVA